MATLFFLTDGAPPTSGGPGDVQTYQEHVWRRDRYEALFAAVPPRAKRGGATPFYLYDRGAHEASRSCCRTCGSWTVAEVGKDLFGAESLERPALVRTPEGRWRLFVSAATPGTKHWRVEVLEADTPQGLADADARTVLAGSDEIAVKDPVLHHDRYGWHLWASVQRFMNRPDGPAQPPGARVGVSSRIAATVSRTRRAVPCRARAS